MFNKLSPVMLDRTSLFGVIAILRKRKFGRWDKVSFVLFWLYSFLLLVEFIEGFIWMKDVVSLAMWKWLYGIVTCAYTWRDITH